MERERENKTDYRIFFFIVSPKREREKGDLSEGLKLLMLNDRRRAMVYRLSTEKKCMIFKTDYG